MIMKQSAPFALLVLLMTFYNRLDPVMLGRLLPKNIGNEQVGIYASGFRLLDAANMIAYLFGVLLVPIFSRMLKRQQPIEQMLKLSFTLIITLAVIVGLGSFFYSYEMMDLLYDTHILASTEVFQLLIPGFIAVSATYIFGTLLTANGNLKQLNYIALFGLGINFLLNYLLIPGLMAKGSAISSLVTQFAMAVLQVWMVQRIFKFRINYRYLLTLLVFLAGVITFNILSRLIVIHWTFLPAHINWVGNFMLMLFLSVILSFVLRLWSFGALLRILREDR
jgi:O-antigen/teichoic acid export membrane protein